MNRQHNQDKLEQLFNEKLGNLEARPSEKVWRSIAGKIPSAKPAFPFKNTLRVAAVLLLILGSLTVFKILDHSKKEQPKVAEKIIQFETKPVVSEQGNNLSEKKYIDREVINKEAVVDREISLQKLEKIEKNSIETKSIGKLIAKNSNQTQPSPPLAFHEIDKSVLNKIPPYSLGIIEIDSAILKNIENTPKPELEKLFRNNLIKIQGFHAGIIYKMNTTWILNQNTYGNFDQSELAYKFTLGVAHGFTLGYDFSSTFGIQTEMILNSNQGQKYQDELKKKTVKREVDLVYSQMQFLVKYKISKLSGIKMHPMVINYLLGISYSSMKSATETINGKSIKIRDRFKDKDYSLVGGLEYDYYFTKRIFGSLGLRGSISYANINDQNWNGTGKYKASHNMTFGVSGGINYLIGK